jgi:hypothetical protein
MVACPELQEGREKNEKKKKILQCPTLPLAKKISQKQISSENTLTFVQTNFTQTKFQQALTLSSLLKTLPRTTADEPPPPFTLLVFDEPPPSFSCSLSLHFRRCRTAEPSTEVRFSLSFPFDFLWNVMRQQGSVTHISGFFFLLSIYFWFVGCSVTGTTPLFSFLQVLIFH